LLPGQLVLKSGVSSVRTAAPREPNLDYHSQNVVRINAIVPEAMAYEFFKHVYFALF